MFKTVVYYNGNLKKSGNKLFLMLSICRTVFTIIIVLIVIFVILLLLFLLIIIIIYKKVGIELRVLHMLHMQSTTEGDPQPHLYDLFLDFNFKIK